MTTNNATPWSDALLHKLQRLDAQFAQRMRVLPDGAQLALRERPAAGRPALTVVLLHGISSSAASWLDVALALPRDWRVLAWDAPGYGASTALPQSHPSDTDYAARLAAWLAADVQGPVVLVGHSLGALMASACAAEAPPPQLAGLLLLSPAGGYGAQDAAAREKVRSERNAVLDTLGVAGLAQRIDQRLLSPGADALARDWVRWSTSRLQASGYRQAVNMLCDSDLGRHAPLALPLRIACGEHDVVTPPAACRGWAEAWQRPFASIADAGHASPVENARAVTEWIEDSVSDFEPGLPQ
ncbi:MAG: alpha/beta hydrolase [Comamonas sp.]|jgi:pimeloyl-ACP methyl ester carboxylesterase|nr:alpha/beta hydrolase [Comamonas sp.]